MSKFQFPFLLFIFSIQLICAQKDEIVLGFETLYTSSTRNGPEDLQWLLDLTDENRSPTISIGLEVLYQKPVSKHLKLGIGLKYSKFGFHRHFEARYPMQHSGNGTFEGEIEQAYFRVQDEFIEAPIRFEYQKRVFKSWRFLSAFTLSPTYYIGTRSKFKSDSYYSWNFHRSQFISDVHAIGSIEIGCSKDIAHSPWKINFCAVSRHFLTNLPKDAPVSEYLYGVGIKLGLRREL